MLMIDISGSGNFGSTEHTKRELMAEIGSILAFSAVHNNDKVGLLLFTDTTELFVPPQKGRSHILRIIREILYFKGQGKKTDLKIALDFTNSVIKRKCVAFLISDFCLPGNFELELQALQTKLQISNKRHDLIAVMVSDPREFRLPDVGWITLEDAETGVQIELNTADQTVRQRYAAMTRNRQKILQKTVRSCGIDHLDLYTDKPYLPELLQFFKRRQGRLV